MQLREDLWAQEQVPVWAPYTGELLYIGHSPLLDAEYLYSTDGELLNKEGANTLLKIHHGEATFLSGEWHNGKELSYKRILKDDIVFAISIDWEDKERKTCVPEVPEATEERRKDLHTRARGREPERTAGVDVLMDSFVNVSYPAHWDTEDDEVYKKIREVALHKYIERIRNDEVELQLEPWNDHDPTDPPEVK